MCKIKFIKEHWREIFFSFTMGITLIIICIIFAKGPSMETFLKGCYILALGFIGAFLFSGGYSLPNEKTWKTFGDTVAICLIIAFVIQTVLLLLSYFGLNVITGKQCLLSFISLFVVYILTFLISVIQICDYKESKEQSTNPAY